MRVIKVVDIIISSKEGAIIRTVASTEVTLDAIIIVVAVDGHFRPRASSCIRSVTTYGVVITIPTDAITSSAKIIIIKIITITMYTTAAAAAANVVVVVVVVVVAAVVVVAVVVFIIIIAINWNMALASCS
jgi:hypothetical protein